jgi:AcrR family transcriptional regulator
MSVPTARANSEQVRRDLLDATVSCLRESGHAQLSTRAIAERAGMPVSQIHYHFGGKDGLLLEVLEHQNRQLLRRQREMFGSDRPLSERWEQACDFLEEDLASGYVRVLQELIAVGWSDPDVAAQVDAQLRGWVDLLTSVAQDAAVSFGLGGIAPRYVAVLCGCAFLGAEQIELLGIGDQIEALDALRSVGRLIEAAEVGDG